MRSQRYGSKIPISELVHIEKKWYNRSMRYTSDLTDAQWEQIKEYFPTGNKSKYDKRELVNAVLYLVKTGCQWRNFPKDFPNWKAVSMFYYHAQKKGVWDKILKMLVKKTRKVQGRNEEPTYALIDSQSVKTTAASEKRGYDGGKNERTQTTYRNRYAWKSTVCLRPCCQYT